MTLKNIYYITLFTLFLGSCDSNPLDVDVSDIKVDIKFLNVDSTIYYSDSLSLLSQHRGYKKDIKDIYSYEIGYCMGIGDVSDTAFYNSIELFKADSSIQKLEGHISLAFQNKSEMESKINDGFKHLKYHFKNGKIPSHIVYLNSLYRSGVFCTENEIGIGLEMFLGDSTDVVQQLNPKFYFDWMKTAMDAKFLERDVLTGWIGTHYIDEADGNLAQHMVRWGKILYLTEAAFPNFEPHIIMRYSAEDYKWAKENEYAFWKYLVDEKLLFKIDERTTMNMINEGPFTPGLPDQKSPDRLGQFIGLQMVRKYMDKNEISLDELVNLTYNDILQEYEID